MSDRPLSEAALYSRMVARLRLRHLRLLVALDECLALGAAAAEVGMSQPAATQMLKELESLLQTQLYERHRRGLRPLPTASLLAEQARLALGNMRHAAEALSADPQEVSLRVGAIPAAITGVLAPRLAKIQQRMPQLRLDMAEDSPEQILHQLNGGLIHMGLVREPSDAVPAPFSFVPLLEDWLVLVASASHPMARRRSLALADLQPYPWSLPWPSHPSGLAFAQACRDAGLQPRRGNLQSISTSLLQTLTGDGLTIAATPRAIVAPLLAQHTLVELKARPRIPLPRLGAMFSATRASPALLAFVELLRSSS